MTTFPSIEALSCVTVRLRRRFWKIFLGALICTLIANILCLPFWTYYDVVGFFRTPINKDARIEMIYTGFLTGEDAFSITSSETSLISPTNYYYGNNAQLYTANLQVGGEWRSYILTLKARRRGYIQIRLKGPRMRNDHGEIYSIATDYRHLKIKDKEIFSDRKKVTYTADFSYRIPVNANETINISFESRRHHFDTEDFNLLKEKKIWYIITLSILAFVVSYSLLYCISMASYRHGRTEDVVFLFVFFLLLAVPLSDISDAQTNVREERALKKHPKISSVFKEKANFGKEYDNWFCDHLGGREYLLKVHDVVKRKAQKILRTSHALYFQEDGWLFVTPFAWIPDLRHVRPVVKSLSDLKLFCDANNIKFYVLMVPTKCSIYQEHLYGYGRNKSSGVLENTFHETIKQLARKRHVPYIYPWSELREASKQTYTFFKLTHHWSDWGAYIGYKSLIKEIRRDFPDIPVVSRQDYKYIRSFLIRDDWIRSFRHGHLEKFFNFEADYGCSVTMYDYYAHKDADKLAFNIENFTKKFRYGGGHTKLW